MPTNVLIAFYSRNGSTEAPGWVENAARMNVAYEASTEADAEWADAIVFGSPTRFGAVTSELKAYIDGLGGLWSAGKLNGKVGSAFTSTSHGGNESTIISLYNPMAHLGLIIVPPGYADPTLFKAGTPTTPRPSPGRTTRRRPRTIWRSHASRAAASRMSPPCSRRPT